MTGLQQQDDMYDTKTQRHQIAAKTYRGVELIPVENIYYFWQIRNMSRTS
jgi:two-component system response regulator AlgR